MTVDTYPSPLPLTTMTGTFMHITLVASICQGGDSMASLTGCWTMGRGAGRVDEKWELSYFYDGSPEPFAPAI